MSNLNNNNENKLSNAVDENFICEECDVSFNSFSQLDVHMKMHTGKELYNFKYCGRGLSSNSRSPEKIHEEVRKFLCKICNRNLSSKCNLKAHQLIHDGILPFECEICNRKFRTKEHLSRHGRIHTGERPYECETCDRRFVQISNLKVHMRSHTKEKYYKCKFCEQRFSYYNSRKYHEENHAKKERYTCKDCLKSFIHYQDFCRHKRTKHKTMVQNNTQENVFLSQATQHSKLDIKKQYAEKCSETQSILMRLLTTK